MLEEKKVQIHQSLTKPILIAGAERELTIIISFTAIIIWIAGSSFISAILSIGFFLVGMYLARAAAKEDPYLVKLFLRYVKYKDYYPATEKLETPDEIVNYFK